MPVETHVILPVQQPTNRLIGASKNVLLQANSVTVNLVMQPVLLAPVVRLPVLKAVQLVPVNSVLVY